MIGDFIYNNMSFFHKRIERRTFSQDRYYTLIKRQKAGEATMRDLDELDEIVNRVPDIREKVLRENFEELIIDEDIDTGSGTDDNSVKTPTVKRRGIWTRLSAFFKGLFTLNIEATSQKFSALC